MKKSNLKNQKQHDLTNLAFGADLQHLQERYKAGGETRKGIIGAVTAKELAEKPLIIEFAKKYNCQPVWAAELVIKKWKGQI